jgi:tryptophan synthase alpha chain
MNRIDELFANLKPQSRAALMPYLPLGYPTLQLSRDLIHAARDAGADMLELGVPFSDPLADGPVIQHATQVALENGMSLAKCLDIVAAVRAEGVAIPLVLMGYYNPLLRYGLSRIARDAGAAGADGFIVPDLPFEEAGELGQVSRDCGLDLVFLAAPTSPPERLKAIGAATGGFLYLVSLTGVTGARSGIPDGLAEFVERTRAVTDKPVCVGFGISTAESARQVAQLADGVIVGSALVAKIGDPATAVENARSFVAELAGSVSRS